MIALYVFALVAGVDQTQLRFVSEGGSKVGYMPGAIELSPDMPEGLRKGAAGMRGPRYGVLRLGERSFFLALDRPKDAPWVLVIDGNRNGDLSDDARINWKKGTYKNQQTERVWERFIGSGEVDFGYGPAKLGLYTFNPEDQAHQSRDKLLFYCDYYWEGRVALGDRTYAVMLTDDVMDGRFRHEPYHAEPAKRRLGPGMFIDRNGDGEFSMWEKTIFGWPFNVGGVVYVAKGEAGRISIERSDRYRISEPKEPANTKAGRKALPFEAKTLDGKSVSFPSSFRGKVVLLDVWATWCGPCIASIPHLKKALARYQDQGLEILSVSIDEPGLEAKVRDAVKKTGMTWPQVYQAKGWKSEIVEQYRFHAIPFALLVDGDTGEVLADNPKLSASDLDATLEAVFKKRRR